MSQNSKHLVKLSTAAIFSALAIVLALLIHIPLFPAASFLIYDPADVPIFITTSLLGPVWGIMSTIAVSIIQGVFVSSDGGVLGIFMHIVATGSYVIAYGIANDFMVKHTKPYFTAQIVSMATGCATMTLIMVPFNLILTPFFTGGTSADVFPILHFIILFNIIKSIVNSGITLMIAPVLRRFGDRLLKQ